MERCGNGSVQRPSVCSEQDVGTGELPSRARAFLGQGTKVRPFVLAQCHKISLGHQSLPSVLQHTTGRTAYQNRCGGPLGSSPVRNPPEFDEIGKIEIIMGRFGLRSKVLPVPKINMAGGICKTDVKADDALEVE